MTRYEYGDPDALNLLIQMVDDHDLSVIESEAAAIREKAGDDFCLIALKVDDWNLDLSPWKAPAVFGSEDFGGGAEKTLEKVLAEIGDRKEQKKNLYIGGYSLAGLFALWGCLPDGHFQRRSSGIPIRLVSGLSPIFERERGPDRKGISQPWRPEERTRNPAMAAVGDSIRETHALLQKKGIECVLEWNSGNHFKDPDIRTAKAFVWVLKS